MRTLDIKALKEALEDEEIAFRQIGFAIKLLFYCELGKICPSEFDGYDCVVSLEQGTIGFSPGNFSDADKINKTAAISVLLAFAGSALGLDQACEAAGIKPCPESRCQRTKLRTLVYIIRCAFAHSLAAPKWEIKGKYKVEMTFELAREKITIDLGKLDGEHFDFPQIGGHHIWFEIRHYLVLGLRKIVNN